MKKLISTYLISIVVATSCLHFDRVPATDGSQLVKTNDGFTIRSLIIDFGESPLEVGHMIERNNDEIKNLVTSASQLNSDYDFDNYLIDIILPFIVYKFTPFISDENTTSYGTTILYTFAKDELYNQFNVSVNTVRVDSVSITLNMSGSQHTATSDRGIVLYYPNESPNNPRIKVSVGETYQPTYQLGLGQLFPQVEYVCQPYMELENGVFIYGDTTRFIIRTPTIETGTYISQPTIQEAALSGKVTFIPGYITVTEIGHCWSTINANPTLNDATLVLGSTSGVQDFNTVLRNIQPGIPYYFRAYLVYNSNKVVYGDSKSFVQ